MRKIALSLAYDGTAYCGWQVQDNGPSIQAEVNRALSEITKEEVHCVGASRTDAGVHARGNVAMFETDVRMPAEKFALALNAHLPADIACRGSWEAAEDFHPRFSARQKTYIYRILNSRFPDPTRGRNSLFYHYPLDEKKMHTAAQALVGEHDFHSFASVHAQTKTWVRTIYSIDVQRDEDDLVEIRICGNGFLYNMVRIIAGTLLEIGSGQRPAEEMAQILAAQDREDAGPTAPACGLTLEEISYT